MVMRTGPFSNLLAPGLRKIFSNEYKGLPTEYDKIAKMGTSERNYETDYEMSMLGGEMPELPQGEPIQYVDPISGNTKTYTHKTFALGFRVTEVMYEDDLYKKVAPLATKGLAKAARNEVESQFWSIFDDAVAGAIYTGFDGHPLAYSAHHILYTGGTYSNTASVDIGVTAVQNACLNIEKQPDSDGIIAGLKAWRLITSPDLKFIVRELLQSANKPYTSGNEINALLDEELSYFITHYTTDTDAWGVLAKEHDINFIWRKKTRFENSDDFDTGDAKFKGRHRHSQGFGAWQGVYWSPGG